LWAPRMGAALLGVFGLLALVLASVGIYGVMAYSVAQRTNEIGIRMALGAQPRSILGLVLQHGLVLTLAGVAAGLIFALAFARLLASLLFGVSAHDPITFVGVSALLVAVAVVAGDAVFLQGDRGDRFYAIESGRAGVSIDGAETRELGPGEFFGEIALLRDVPRTATVRALDGLRLYAVARDDFIAAVTGHAPSLDAAENVVAMRLPAGAAI